MFVEPSARHHTPHFHAYYGEFVGVFSIDGVEVLAGSLPQKQTRLVEAWAEIHQGELMADWDRLLKRHPAIRIAPLE